MEDTMDPGMWGWGRDFQMIQLSIQVSYYYISSMSDQQTLDPREVGTLPLHLLMLHRGLCLDQRTLLCCGCSRHSHSGVHAAFVFSVVPTHTAKRSGVSTSHRTLPSMNRVSILLLRQRRGS